jgi:hypothetical protein
MTLAWEESQKKALVQMVDKAGINLAEEMERQFKAAKTAFAVGARYILPRVGEDGVEIPASHQPATFYEALMLMKNGGDTMREIAKTLTGGEPLLPSEATGNRVQVIVQMPMNGHEAVGTEFQTEDGSVYKKIKSGDGYGPIE